VKDDLRRADKKSRLRTEDSSVASGWLNALYLLLEPCEALTVPNAAQGKDVQGDRQCSSTWQRRKRKRGRDGAIPRRAPAAFIALRALS
jgi:hypothetical protein